MFWRLFEGSCSERDQRGEKGSWCDGEEAVEGWMEGPSKGEDETRQMTKDLIMWFYFLWGCWHTSCLYKETENNPWKVHSHLLFTRWQRNEIPLISVKHIWQVPTYLERTLQLEVWLIRAQGDTGCTKWKSSEFLCLKWRWVFISGSLSACWQAAGRWPPARRSVMSEAWWCERWTEAPHGLFDVCFFTRFHLQLESLQNLQMKDSQRCCSLTCQFPGESAGWWPPSVGTGRAEDTSLRDGWGQDDSRINKSLQRAWKVKTSFCGGLFSDASVGVASAPDVVQTNTLRSCRF